VFVHFINAAKAHAEKVAGIKSPSLQKEMI
jgi:hypothetical protein